MPKQVNYVGHKNALLTVTENAGREEKGGKQLVICQCECGNITKPIRATNLFPTKAERERGHEEGRVKSCGCLKISVGELRILQTLQASDKTFAREYTFADTPRKFRFDFAVMTADNELDYLIEYDGEQHYNNSSGGWNVPNKLELTQESDKQKNEFCKANDITLIRIPYTQQNNITLELLQKDSPYAVG